MFAMILIKYDYDKRRKKYNIVMNKNYIRIYDGAGHCCDVRCSSSDSSLLEKIQAYIIADCFDEQDIHYFRKPRVLKKGTVIIISSIIKNLYGTYFRTYVNNLRFDIKPSFVSFVKP